MDLEQVKKAFALTNAKKEEVDRKIDEISLLLVKQRRDLQGSLLDELHELEVQQNHLKEHSLSLRQQLSKRGLTTSEINSIPKTTVPSAAPAADLFAFPSTPKQAPAPSPHDKKLLETIEHEKYHQKHIQEVEQWNQQEMQRQQAIREQNLKLLQLHEQLQQMKISEEQDIAKQKEEVAREQEALKKREKELNDQQKQQINIIDDKLAQLRFERERLAGAQQKLSPGQQKELKDLQAKRRDILCTNQAQTSDFPTIPNFPSQNIPTSYGTNQTQQMDQRSFGLDNLAIETPQFNTMQPNSAAPQNLAAYGSQANSNSFVNSHTPQTQDGRVNTRNGPPAYSQTMNYNARDENPEIQAWKKEQEALQGWQQHSTTLQETHQEKLQRQEREYMQSLQQREEALRSQWTQELTQQQAQIEQERSQVHQELTDDMLCRMSEAELRMWMNHAQKNQFIDEMLSRRQKLLDEQAWLLQQDLENKTMALSFREDDLRKKEWEIDQQREAERRALARVFAIIVETTNPEGKRTGKTYQMQVRAGDSLFRICERIPHDKELFCVRMDFNGNLMEDLDKNLLELNIPDNAFMIARLLPKADVDVLNLIPCEDCGKRYHAEVFAAHKCMKQFANQELPSDRKAAVVGSRTVARQKQPVRRVVRAQPKTQEVIPCEYCDGLFPTARYDSHVRTCPERRDPVPRVTRYRYY